MIATIALKVLSILLIIILAVLIIVLLLCSIVLFLPVKYRADGFVTENEKRIAAQARWLWGIVRFRFWLTQDEHETSLKVLWIELLKKEEPVAEEEELSQEKGQDIQEMDETIVEEHTDTTESATSQTDAQLNENEPEEKEKFSFRKVYDKILNCKDNVTYYIDILRSNATYFTIEDCKKVIGKVLLRIRPKKLRIHATVGFDGPDTTGYFYGLYCIFSGFLGKNVIVKPDFDKKILQGDFFCKGKIYGITLLVAACRLFFHKGLRKLIDEVKKGGI